MQASQTAGDEVKDLRHLAEELAELSRLSAAWSSSNVAQIAQVLAAVLCRSLPLSFVYIRLYKDDASTVIEAARSADECLPDGQARDMGVRLEPWFSGNENNGTVSIADPFGSGTVQLVVMAVGSEGDCGFVAAGSRHVDFPSRLDRLICDVALTQAAVVLQQKGSEARLRRREHELADFFDNAAIGLHCVGPDGIILRANQAELDLLGYAPDEYIGHHIAEFHADEEVIEDILERLWEGETLRDYEARMRCKDGSIRHVLIDSSVFREDGQFVHTRCFTRDITDRRQIEETLRHTEEKYRRLVGLMPVALYTCEAPSGLITFFNDHAVELWGRTPRADDCDERFCGSLRLWQHDGSLLPHDQTPMAVALRDGCSFRNREVVIERPDGTRITVLVNIDPIRNDDGQLIGAINVFHDTTALKQAHESMRESEHRMRELIDALPAAIYTTDGEGRLTHFNSAAVELSGKTPQLGTDQWCVSWKLYSADGAPLPHDQCPMAVSLRENRAVRGEEIIAERPDGTRVWCEPFPMPLRDSAGKVVGGINMLVDITDRKRANEALRESEQRFRLMAQSVPCIIWTADPDGTITYANDSWYRYCGLSPEDNARNWSELVLHPDDRARCLAEWSRALREGSDYEIEVRNRGVDGSWRWFVTRAVPLRDDSGRIIQWFGTTTDIDDRKRHEDTNRFLASVSGVLAELTDCETTLQRVAGLAVPFFADWCAVDLLDNSGTLKRMAVTHVNEDKIRLAHQLNRRYPPRADDPHGVWKVIASGQAECVPEISDEMLESAVGDPDQLALVSELGLRSYLCVPLRCAGRTFGALTFVTAESKRIFSAQDLRVAEDLADRVAVAIDNTRLYERLRLLWEAAAVLLSAVDPDAMLRGLFAKISPHLGVDVYFNFMMTEAADALQLASCAGISDTVAQSITRLELGQAVCGTVALHRQPIVATYIQQSDDPKVQLVRSLGIRAYACNPLMTGDRLLGTLSFASRTKDEFDPAEIAFLETICQYVTAAFERLRLLNEMKEADRRKDEFLATLAHELRNPLAPVRNAVKVLDLKGSDEPEARWSRDVIERQVAHLTRLIDDLLDISRITRNKLELRKQMVQLTDVITGAVESSRPLIEQYNHELTVSLPAEPITLEGDLVRLSQVFLNLLNNAAKYTSPGGKIWLTAWRQDSEIVVAVKDTGVGIPAETLPSLFEMFFQVDRSLERSQGGLGIGLSLVRRLVELHDGRVDARSDGPGKGSEFTVRLPIVCGEQPTAVTPGSGNGKAHVAVSRRILVVDDKRESADSLAMLLKLSGNEVCTAYDGVQAVEQAEGFHPDIVLLDIGMPRMNGVDACRHIRSQPWGAGMTLIALTGWGQNEDRRRCMEAGFDYHLTKPVDPAALFQLLDSQLHEQV